MVEVHPDLRVQVFYWMELLRSKCKRLTQKWSFLSTDYDLAVEVDVEDRTLCWNFKFAKLFWLLCSKSTNKI